MTSTHTGMLLQPRRNSDRRIRRKRFRSAFCKSPVAPPFRWLLTAQEFADARGVKLSTVAAWRSVWRQNDFQSGPDARPVRIPPSTEWFYRYDDVIPGADFVATMKADRAAWIESNSAAVAQQSNERKEQL
jgi:hypothetical protein